MFVVAARFDLHLPGPRSLKEKRAIVKPIVEGSRRRFAVSVAEVDHQDRWQRAAIGVAVVASDRSLAEHVLDGVERFVWSFPEVEVVGSDRMWLDDE